MIEIYENLFIGNELDFERKVKFERDWYVKHACKEPYHRRELGYVERGAPKAHPEYLIAKRKNSLILNLIDVDKPSYIPKEIIDTVMEEIEKNLQYKKKVLVHCNQGFSRSATIGLLYLAMKGYFQNLSFLNAEQEYKKIYPFYNPANGIRMYAEINWNKYNKIDY